MLDKNTDLKNCGNTESLLAFLYEEIEPNERLKFETHLMSCSGCERELAAFGLVRSSIGIWKQDEFLPMEVPGFEIPQHVKTPRVAASETIGWFDGFLRLFSPLRAALAFAAVVLCVGITMVIFRGGGSDLAVKPAEQIPVVNTEEPVENTSEIAIPDLARESDTEPRAENAVVEREASQKTKATVRRPASNAKTRIAAVPDTRRPTQIANQRPNENTVAGQNLMTGDSPVSAAEQMEIPVLSNVAIEEDNSVRLSDLFDEVGSD